MPDLPGPGGDQYRSGVFFHHFPAGQAILHDQAGQVGAQEEVAPPAENKQGSARLCRLADIVESVGLSKMRSPRRDAEGIVGLKRNVGFDLHR